MQKAILAAAAALAIGSATTGILVANAQPAPPAPGADDPLPPQQRPHWRMGSMHRGHGDADQVHSMLRNLALVYPQADRKLTAPDVQKIAEAFLLWHGNHTWKVVDVAEAQNGAIGFTYATQDGGAIARFTMDPHTGRVTRIS